MKITHFVSSAILVIVTASVLGSVINPASLVAQKKLIVEPTPTPVGVYQPKYCAPLQPKTGKNKIILQINDVQGYAWRETIMKMVEDANSINIPVTLSVIPERIDEDQVLVNFIKDNACRLEIGQQGTRIGSSSEFKGMSSLQIKDRLVEGKSVLQWVLGKEVSVFVPPYNWYTQTLFKASDDVGYKAVAIEGVFRKTQGIATYSYYRKRLLTDVQVAANCTQAFVNGRACIVILYPNKYEGENYVYFEELLEKLNGIKNSEFTTFESIS